MLVPFSFLGDLLTRTQPTGQHITDDINSSSGQMWILPRCQLMKVGGYRGCRWTYDIFTEYYVPYTTGLHIMHFIS